MNIYLVCFVLIAIIMILYCFKSTNEQFTNTKPYLFTYWEMKKDAVKIPDYINLCLDTILKNGKLFNVVILNENTVYDYLPDLRTDINSLPLALKVDYIRIMLLYKYGGFWLDADMILLKDLHEVIDLLDNGEDFIGFGCTAYKCLNGYGRPSNWAMGSKKNGLMMKKCLELLDLKLDKYFSDKNKKEFDYYDLGKKLIWEVYDELAKTNYKYYHFSSDVDGSRDKNGLWIAPDTILNEKFDIDEDKLMMVMLVNNYFCGKDPKYNWYCEKTKKEILSDNSFASKMFIKALK